jgi:hypothetical protein
MSKERIPRALREQVWVTYVGNKFQTKCWIPWCKNKMSAFDFHVGHNLPESKGGTLELGNLRPICARCNLSMSDTYTISEWMAFAGPKRCLCFVCGPPPSIDSVATRPIEKRDRKTGEKEDAKIPAVGTGPSITTNTRH